MTESVHLAVRADRDRLRTALAGAAGGHLGPAQDRWCGVLPPPGTDPDAFAAALSESLGAPVLAVRLGVGLDLRLFLYGELLTGYRTGDPAAAAPPPADVERLIDATGSAALPGELARLLGDPAAEPEARYAALVAALGLPGYLVDAAAGGVPPGFEPVDAAAGRRAGGGGP